MDQIAYSPEFAAFLEELGAEETIEREFKEAKNKLLSSIWETISAFSNTSGGIIALGVREIEQGLALVGVADARRLVEDLHNQNRNRQKINRDVFRPEDIVIREVDGLSVVVIRVRPAEPRMRPIFINGQPYGGTRVRRHSGDYAATDEEVIRMMREASDLPADMVILPWVALEHLDRDALATYRRRALILDERSPLAEFNDMEFLQAIDGYREDMHSGNSGGTVAGLLMFGSESAIRHWRPRHLIDARLLPPGADRDEPDWADRVIWEGHLFGAYDRIYPWLTRDLPVPFRLEQGVRVNESEQHRVLREALVNMLVHADYAERGVSLILRWDGGVFFRNPGRSRIPAPGFHSGNRSDPRNPVLLRMFRRIGRAEEAGTGVPRIFRAWRELGYDPPEIDPGDERYEFVLTLPYQHLLSEEDRAWLAEIGGTLTHPEQLALVIARFDEWVDNQALREVTGLHGADASKVLTGLRDRGLLQMTGSKRGASYQLSEGLAALDMMISATDTMVSDADMMISATNTMVSDADMITSDAHRQAIESSVVGIGTRSVDRDHARQYADRLLQIAEPARQRRRISSDQLREIVIQLCMVEMLSAPQLARLVNRSEVHVRQVIGALVHSGDLKQEHRARRHPGQRYAANRARTSPLTVAEADE